MTQNLGPIAVDGQMQVTGILYGQNTVSGTPQFSAQNGSASLLTFSNTLTAGLYNPIVQAGDSGFIFSNGASGTGALVIAPYLTAAGGVRMTSAGNVAITGTLAVSGTLSAGNTAITAGPGVGLLITGNTQNNPVLSTTNGTAFLYQYPGNATGAVNPIVQTGDNVILYSGTGTSGTGALTIAPYGSGGLRMDNNGNLVETGTLTVSGTTALTGNTTLFANLAVNTIYPQAGTTVTLNGSLALERHLVAAAGAAPTVALGAGAGTGATVSLVTGPSDMSGTVTFKSGTGLTASAALVTVTFAVAYLSVPNVFLSPSDSGTTAIAEATAALTGASTPWGNATTTTFSINSNTTVPAQNTNYCWNYFLVG